jgi:hypothetical protein
MNGDTASTYVQVLGLYLRIVYVTILSFVFVSWHGCETWSVQLREDHRLRLFDNSILRRMFGPMREEVIG